MTELTVEVISDDADDGGALRPPLRLDVVASEATHKKLMLVSSIQGLRKYGVVFCADRVLWWRITVLQVKLSRFVCGCHGSCLCQADGECFAVPRAFFEIYLGRLSSSRRSYSPSSVCDCGSHIASRVVPDHLAIHSLPPPVMKPITTNPSVLCRQL